MTQEEIDKKYMHRCIQLAKNGELSVGENPMVGAVIVAADGRIIGEGYHVRCGEGHAEVNAFTSVKASDETLLKEATLYVSLEPCAHFGKTPPCSELIVRKGVKRVVCGCVDPFSAVQGRGIERIKAAGIDVCVGVLERECLELNRKFITINTLGRPYIILKWAQTANGIIGFREGERLQISTPFTKMLVHRLRAAVDAILVGRTTEVLEQPQLNVRDWIGKSPQKLVLSALNNGEESKENMRYVKDLQEVVSLRETGIRSLLVEGGAKTLQSFIDSGLWDEIRIETAPFIVKGGVAGPRLPHNIRQMKTEEYGNRIVTYRRTEL